MKIDAKIKWLIDEPDMNISVDKIDRVTVDADYCEANAGAITEWVENELAETYGTGFYVGQDDFVIMNMDELIEELAFEEFEDKTDYANV